MFIGSNKFGCYFSNLTLINTFNWALFYYSVICQIPQFPIQNLSNRYFGVLNHYCRNNVSSNNCSFFLILNLVEINKHIIMLYNNFNKLGFQKTCQFTIVLCLKMTWVCKVLFRLARYSQNWHWNFGSFPHSWRWCWTRFLFCLYIRPHPQTKRFSSPKAKTLIK